MPPMKRSQRIMKSLSPNDLGTFLVEGCPKIKISDFVRKYRTQLKEAVIASDLELQGIKVELTTSRTCYNGIRLWFKCPTCKGRVGVIFKHPMSEIVGCRKCLKLEYKKRRYKGMIEGSL